MIDITAILGEIYDRISAASANPFTSLVYAARVRELVTAAQMPACDIAGGSATSVQRAGYTEWSALITIVIRSQSVKRRTGAGYAMQYANWTVSLLRNTKGVCYDVFRDFAVTTIDDDETGTGATVHTAVIQFTARKDS